MMSMNYYMIELILPKLINITEKEYFVRGSTALLDAIGKTIAKEKAIQDTLGKNEKADKVFICYNNRWIRKCK